MVTFGNDNFDLDIMNIPETIMILSEYKKLKEYAKAKNYEDCDIRLEYFQLMLTIFNRFHKNFGVMDLFKKIAEDKLLGEIILPNESFRFVFEDFLDESNRNAYFNDSSRSFIIDSWSVFELVVTQLLEFLLKKVEKEEFINKEYIKIQLLLDEEIKNESKRKKILKLLREGQFVKSSITHQSVNRRYDKLFSIIKDKYKRPVYIDKEFLRFLGAYRNSLHFNFVYFGKSFDYSFENLSFRFIDGESIITPREPWEVRIINELIEITKEIFNGIEEKQIKSNVNYPD